MEMGIWEVTELLPEMECEALVDRGGFDTMKECQNALILLGSGPVPLPVVSQVDGRGDRRGRLKLHHHSPSLAAVTTI